MTDPQFIVPSAVIVVPTVARVPFHRASLRPRPAVPPPRGRGRVFGSNSVAQLHSVKPVAVRIDVFDCLEVHYRGLPTS